MTNPQVLVIGIDPDAVDFAAPGFPPGLTAERVWAEIDGMHARFAAAGLDERHLMLRPGEPVATAVTAALAGAPCDCVVIGGGVRTPATMVETLEEIVAAVRAHAPNAAIAFNATPADSIAAAQRRLGSR